LLQENPITGLKNEAKNTILRNVLHQFNPPLHTVLPRF
jgi:hypothetical protein